VFRTARTFLDGLYIDAGDVRPIFVWRSEGARTMVPAGCLIDGGTASPGIRHHVPRGEKLSGRRRKSTFLPDADDAAVPPSDQSAQPNGGGRLPHPRVDLRLAQSLHLPLDLKVLLGIELARAENSRILLDALDADGVTRRYLGGLAVNF